jgi:hypothetical protein
MDSLDARQIDEARGTAYQRAACERQSGNGLVAALGDRTRAISEPLATLEQILDLWVGLEALEFVERRQIGIPIVKMNHEANRDQIAIRSDRGMNRRR